MSIRTDQIDCGAIDVCECLNCRSLAEYLTLVQGAPVGLMDVTGPVEYAISVMEGNRRDMERLSEEVHERDALQAIIKQLESQLEEARRVKR
ncbi:MAG: hypothetical protein ACR2P3_00325 [Geminicoccaceae bacterium]